MDRGRIFMLELSLNLVEHRRLFWPWPENLHNGHPKNTDSHFKLSPPSVEYTRHYPSHQKGVLCCSFSVSCIYIYVYLNNALMETLQQWTLPTKYCHPDAENWCFRFFLWGIIYRVLWPFKNSGFSLQHCHGNRDKAQNFIQTGLGLCISAIGFSSASYLHSLRYFILETNTGLPALCTAPCGLLTQMYPLIITFFYWGVWGGREANIAKAWKLPLYFEYTCCLQAHLWTRKNNVPLFYFCCLRRWTT